MPRNTIASGPNRRKASALIKNNPLVKAKSKGALSLVRAASKKPYKNKIMQKASNFGKKIADRIVYGKNYKPTKGKDIQKGLDRLKSSMNGGQYDTNAFKKTLPKGGGSRPKYVPTGQLI